MENQSSKGRRFGSHVRSNVIPMKRNLYMNPADPLYHEKVLQYVDPASPEAHYHLGLKHAAAGDRNRAAHHLGRCMQTYSPYYYKAKAELLKLTSADAPQLASQMETNAEAAGPNWDRRMMLIGALLIALCLLLLVLREIPSSGKASAAAREIPAAPMVDVMSEEEADLLGWSRFSTNLVRTALAQYKEDNGYYPVMLQGLTEAYPDNYLSGIPIEPISGSAEVSSVEHGRGGWLYSPGAASLEEAFRPNLTEAADIPYHPVEVLVAASEHRLYVLHDSSIVKAKPVGLGRDNRTPYGNFTIMERVLIPEGGPTDIYGMAALGFGDYALHGTADRSSIGQNRSLGCIRLYNEDLLDIYPYIAKGTAILVTDTLSDSNRNYLSQYNATRFASVIARDMESAGQEAMDWLG